MKYISIFISFILFNFTTFSLQAATFREAQRAAVTPSNIKPTGGTNTQVIEAQNGITIVNIAAPTTSGTSVNYFNEFNVSESGAIINNSLYITNTNLAGQIMQNNNLVNGGNVAATTIVGEVFSLYPSNLLGYLEIAGQSANFILLNPNGIYCNGCGFINVNKATLAAGSGIYQEGNLTDINIQGNINFEGAGADATLINHFIAIAKYINVNASIYGGDKTTLELQAGSGNFNLQNGKFNKVASSSDAVGIDASTLGSMYSGSIILNASTEGLGVNLNAEAVASSGGITITSNGDIIYNQTLKAETEINIAANNINSNANITAGNININANETLTNNSQVIASNNINITSNNTINDGFIAAGANTNITGTEGIINNGTITGTNIVLASDGTILNTKEINAFGNLTIKGDANKSATLFKNDTAKVKANGDISIYAYTFENTGTDFWGNESGYTVHTVYYPKPGGFYGWTLLSEEVATSTITTQNSLLFAGGNIYIEGDVLNHGGDISAGKDITIKGDVVNKTTSVVTGPLKQFWQEYYENCDTLGTNCWTNTNERYPTYTSLISSQTASTIKAGGNIAITGGTLVNTGGNAHTISNLGVNDAGSLIDIINQNILTSSIFNIIDNGISEVIIGIDGKPITFTYITETAVEFTGYENFITSTYFFTAINFFPDKDIYLLDPVAENELLLMQLNSLNMLSYLNNQNGINDLYEEGALWFNENQSGLNLTFGVELTEEQLASLTSPIVLPVFMEIEGMMVLVPQIYIPNGYNDSALIGGAIMAGGNVEINVTNDLYNSGLISSGGDINLTAGESIINLGGTLIAVNDINITGEDILFGSLNHLSGDGGLVISEIIGTASIEAGGSVSITGGNDVLLLGTSLEAGGNLLLEAGGDVVIGGAYGGSSLNLSGVSSLVEKEQVGIASNIIVGGDVSVDAGGSFSLIAAQNIIESSLSTENNSGIFGGGVTTETTQIYTLTNTASTITTSGNLTINTIDNINIIGSNITTEGNINLTTEEGSVNVVAVVDKESSFHQTNSADIIGSEIDINSHQVQTIVGSNLTSGGNINIDSGNDINIVASNLTGTEGSLTATGDVNIISLQNIEQTYTFHQETSMSLGAIVVGATVAVGVTIATGGSGAFAIAGAAASGGFTGSAAQEGYADATTTITLNNISSNLNFGGNLEITTQEGNVNLVASNITAEESVTINLNGENSQLNLIEKEDVTTTTTTHTDISPNYINVILVSGISAGLNQGSQTLAGNGAFGTGVAEFVEYGSFTLMDGLKPTQPLSILLGATVSSPTMLIPNSFFTSTNQTTSTSITTTIVKPTITTNNLTINNNHEKP